MCDEPNAKRRQNGDGLGVAQHNHSHIHTWLALASDTHSHTYTYTRTHKYPSAGLCRPCRDRRVLHTWHSPPPHTPHNSLAQFWYGFCSYGSSTSVDLYMCMRNIVCLYVYLVMCGHDLFCVYTFTHTHIVVTLLCGRTKRGKVADDDGCICILCGCGSSDRSRFHRSTERSSYLGVFDCVCSLYLASVRELPYCYKSQRTCVKDVCAHKFAFIDRIALDWRVLR